MTLYWKTFMVDVIGTFINVWPEAICCCCLQTCYVDVMLPLMDCICIPPFIALVV